LEETSPQALLDEKNKKKKINLFMS